MSLDPKRKSSDEIKELFDYGKILQAQSYLKNNPGLVSQEMTQNIIDEVKFYNYTCMKIHKSQ